MLTIHSSEDPALGFVGAFNQTVTDKREHLYHSLTS